MERDHRNDEFNHEGPDRAAGRAGDYGHDASSLERLSVQLQGIARQIGAMSRARFDSPDFVDLLDASDAVWRAAVALDRVVRVSSSTGDQAGEGLAHYRRRGSED